MKKAERDRLGGLQGVHQARQGIVITGQLYAAGFRETVIINRNLFY